jgi:predicted DNA-binding transcriptional regulator YafY
MAEFYWKRDRTARLLKVQLLLAQYSKGLKIEEIARICSISKRTVYRDLVALETELGVPVWEDGNKRGINKDFLLPPISFTLQEAVNIFFAGRLLRNFFYIDNINLFSTFLKLSAVVPLQLRKHIQDTIKYTVNQPKKDEKITSNFNKIINAWLAHKRIKILYRKEPSEKEPKERVIEIYFIEVSVLRRACYIIANSPLDKRIEMINVANIIGDVLVEPDHYDLPDNFDANDYLSTAWDVHAGGKVVKVKLHFNNKVSKIIKQTILHPSQEIKIQDDDSVIVSMQINIRVDFCDWILSWGDNVEVLEPEILRKWIIDINRSVIHTYQSHILPSPSVRDSERYANMENQPSELTDGQWKLVSAIVPLASRIGRPRVNDRKIINGILWVLRNGGKWADVPRKYGTRSTCNSRFLAWQKQGIWAKICQTLSLTSDNPH